jgi:hypothetical protein
MEQNYLKKLFFLFVLVFMGAAEVMGGAFCPISTTTNNYQYDPSWHFEWNPENPDSIDQGLSLAVSVIGGEAPYTWIIEKGYGFELRDISTSGVTNHLLANENACGAVWVTVMDKRGLEVNGSLRCTASGHWVLKQTGACVMPGIPNQGNSQDYIVGGKWQYEGPWTYYDVDSTPPFKCPKSEGCIGAIDCVWCKRRKNPEITGDLARNCFSHAPCILRMPGYGDDLWCAKNWQRFYYEWECPE